MDALPFLPTNGRAPAPLNESQLRAVTAQDAPQLVLAGPGTGKTRVLTYRAAYLLRRPERPILPSELILVTFTRKAAGQLRQRLAALVGRDAAFVRAGTLHFFAYSLLRRHAAYVGLPDDFVVADEAVTEPFWQQVARDENGMRLPELQREVSRLRLALGTGSPAAVRVKRRYEAWLAERGLVDFDGLLVYTRDLLRDHRPVREALQARCGALLVDEFQDTDPVQFRILREVMCPERQGLFVVADDDQSIYGFRGADVRNVRRFQETFGCRPGSPNYHVLNDNYRSSKAIFAVAESVLDSEDRMKRAGDVEALGPAGEPVEITACADADAEVAHVVSTIERLIRTRAMPCRELAVLTPRNDRNVQFEEALLARGIPCDVSGDERLTAERVTTRLRAFLELLHHLACHPDGARGARFDALVDAVLLLYAEPSALEALADARMRLAHEPHPTLAALRTLAASALAGEGSDATAAATWVLTILESLAEPLRDPATTVRDLVLRLLPLLDQPLGLLNLVADEVRAPDDSPSILTAADVLRRAARGRGRLLVHVENPVLARLYTLLLEACVEEHAEGDGKDRVAAVGERSTRTRAAHELDEADVVVTDDLSRTEALLLARTGSLFDAPAAGPHVVDLAPERTGRPAAERYHPVDAEGHYESPAVRLFKTIQASAPAGRSGTADYTVIDLETTSLDTQHCRVVEFGAVRVRGGEVVAEFETRVALPDDLTRDEWRTVADISGFARTDFDDAPPLQAAWLAFTEFVGTDPIVAYNGTLFDFPVLNRLARELAHAAPKRWSGEHDMLLDARRLLPRLKSHRAEDVRRHLFGDAAPDTEHRALADCRDQHALNERLAALDAERRRARGFEPLLAAVAMAMGGGERDTTLRHAEERLLFQIGFLWIVRGEHPVVARVRSALPRGLDPLEALTRRPAFADALLNLPPELQRGRTAPRLRERLQAVLRPYADRKVCDGATADLLAFLALWNEPQDALPADVVTISTYHSAKGLEFGHVFCTGVHDSAFPWFFLQRPERDPEREAERQNGLKESRRLLYVGLTRAKQRLTVTYPEFERGHRRRPSTFLANAPPESIERVRVANAPPPRHP